jgi:hypothetical protein
VYSGGGQEAISVGTAYALEKQDLIGPKLPLLIIAENNGWAYCTPTRMQMTIENIAARGEAYGIPASILEKDGLSLEIVDLRTLLPYDEEAVLASIRKCNKVILPHEDTRTGGMAGELAALIAEKAFEDMAQ